MDEEMIYLGESTRVQRIFSGVFKNVFAKLRPHNRSQCFPSILNIFATDVGD